MIDKALMAIQSTNLFETAVLEWIVFNLVNQSCPKSKEHFSKAYENRIISGARTAVANNSHGAANAFETKDNDNIQSMKETFASI